jgi:hypothetical protein
MPRPTKVGLANGRILSGQVCLTDCHWTDFH